ncbi:MAG TPA: hypothetical protein DDY68_05220, partial [Porphyromonadaceae bacterium]|nr:hypothetical protein [Porphyromonadaceae bacterium]
SSYLFLPPKATLRKKERKKRKIFEDIFGRKEILFTFASLLNNLREFFCRYLAPRLKSEKRKRKKEKL